MQISELLWGSCNPFLLSVWAFDESENDWADRIKEMKENDEVGDIVGEERDGGEGDAMIVDDVDDVDDANEFREEEKSESDVL